MFFYFLGELTMKKVKVHRYVSGKRPEYAPMSSSEEDSDDDDFIAQRRHKAPSPEIRAESDDSLPDDSRLRRLKSRRIDERRESDDEESAQRHRYVLDGLTCFKEL